MAGSGLQSTWALPGAFGGTLRGGADAWEHRTQTWATQQPPATHGLSAQRETCPALGARKCEDTRKALERLHGGRHPGYTRSQRLRRHQIEPSALLKLVPPFTFSVWLLGRFKSFTGLHCGSEGDLPSLSVPQPLFSMGGPWTSVSTASPWAPPQTHEAEMPGVGPNYFL